MADFLEGALEGSEEKASAGTWERRGTGVLRGASTSGARRDGSQDL